MKPGRNSWRNSGSQKKKKTKLKKRAVRKETVSLFFFTSLKFVSKAIYFLKFENQFKQIITMEFKNADILITDPCYILTEEEMRGDYLLNETLPQGIVGMVKATGYGDWTCHIFTTRFKDVIKHLQDVTKSQSIPKSEHSLGTFSADAGLVCVIDLKSLDREHLDLVKKLKKDYPWCGVEIKNYTGTVEFWLDQNKYVHVIGKNFYSILG